MQHIEGLLKQVSPLIRLIALVFGFIASVQALTELVPVVAQFWKPAVGSAQTNAIIAAALSLVVSNIVNKG